MADWYCNFSTGNDTTGDGSSGNKYKTLTKCESVASNNDRILAQNTTAYLETLTLTDKSLTVIGYATTVGDNGRIVIDGEDTRANCILISLTSMSNSLWIFENIECLQATGDGIELTRTGGGFTNDLTFVNCISHDNGAKGFHSGYSACFFHLINCDSYNNVSDGMDLSGAGSMCRSRSFDNGGHGILSGQSLHMCIFAGNGGHGADDNLGAISNCIFYGNTLAGVDGGARSGFCVSCAFVGNGTFGADDPAENSFIDCCFYNNTSGALNGTALYESGTITSDPKFTDAANYDFSLASDSPLRNVEGEIGAYGSGVPTYPDTGIIQADATAGGGGGGVPGNTRGGMQ